MKIKQITWEEFDEAVAKFPKPIGDSFYPIPRGGLVLAVALSHRFNLPVVTRPTRLSIIVEDIVDSGKTILKTRLTYGTMPVYTLVKRKSTNVVACTHAFEMVDEDWIVFPWEDKKKVKDEYEKYLSR